MVDTVEKMKEPPPQNRKEALALALNSVYRKNLVRNIFQIEQGTTNVVWCRWHFKQSLV